MAQKDSFEIQAARIKRAAQILCPQCLVFFDETRGRRWIRFRIEDGTGTILTSAHPEYDVSEVADWTDQKVEQIIHSLTAGRLGPNH